MENNLVIWKCAWLLFLGTQQIFRSSAADDNRVKIENEWARGLVVDSLPGAKSELHEHKINRVMVYLDEGRMTLTDSAARTELNFKKDQVLWSSVSGPHVSENLSDHAVRIVEIELKPAGTNSVHRTALTDLDWVKVDPKRYKIEFENDYVRVVRVHYQAHEKGVLHEHPYKLLVVYLSDGRMKITPAEHEPVSISCTRGDLKFGGPSKHLEENLSDSPLDIIVVENKG